ncbi:MAG: hypothetical protein AAF386_05815, partial [Pseudomonadota bacterium]
TELLLVDTSGATRSWFQVEMFGQGTRLWFGSAVVATNGTLPLLARILMPFHHLYARLLLWSAGRKLR